MTRRQPAKPPRPLTPRQQRFVAEYLKDLNGTQAAIRAGYASHAANRTASLLLTNSVISADIAKGTAQQLAKADLSATRVLEELRRLAFVDVAGVWSDAGNLKPFTEWSEEQRAALAGFEAIIKNAAAGDNKTDLVHKVKMTDKTKALEILARHFALLHDQVTIEGDWDKFAARLASAKLRMGTEGTKA